MSQRRVASKDELVNPETSQTTTAMESRYEVLGEGPAIRRYLLVPLLFIGIVVPFVLAGIYVPTKDGPDDDALEGWVLYSYVACVGQCYRLVAGGLNLFAWFAEKPLLPFLGDQPAPPIDVVLPFFLDFTVGFSSIIIACNWTRDAQMWGAMILWVAYGWLDHIFAGYYLFFCERFGPYPRLLLGKLGFEVFVVTSVLWQGSNLVALIMSREVHEYFNIKTSYP